MQVDTAIPLLLTAKESARLLSVSQRTIYAITEPRGPLPCVRIGSRGIRYSRAAFEEFAAGGPQNADGGHGGE